MKYRIKKICKKCENEFEVIPSRYSAKYCSYKCSNNRIRTKDELDKISKGSKQKFIDNPELRNVVAKSGSINIKKANDNGTAFRMPKGYHTDTHKKYMSELMTDRYISDETKLKIKENHWSNSANVDEIISKIKKSKETSEKWNSEERINRLANWSMDNPDKIGPKFYKKGRYKSKKTNIEEYYASGFEKTWMGILDDDTDVIHWTKNHKIKIPYTYKNKIRNYIPDFLITYTTNNKTLLETKGRIYNQEIIDAKNEAAIKYCKSIKIEYKIIYQ